MATIREESVSRHFEGAQTRKSKRALHMFGGCAREGQPHQADGRAAYFSFSHVPQQCRREKLRYATGGEAPPFSTPAPYNPSPYDSGLPPADLFNPSTTFNPSLIPGGGQQLSQGFSLSLSTAAAPSSSAGPPPLQRFGQVPAGPFTGYSTILNSSRFLRPAQHLLEETCGGAAGASPLAAVDDGEALDFAGDIHDSQDAQDGMLDDQRRIQSRLIMMLDEVYRRYKQYEHQIQAVISSFESVSGLSMAAPYATLALRTLSKHFNSLKRAIVDQLRYASQSGKKVQSGEDPLTYRSAVDSAFCYPRFSAACSQPQPPWRPQRGLPERAVSVLRSWLFEHFLHPYPTDMDKQLLARQTGLSRNQVSNWFINARVRLWKPMVEEIHSLELQSDHGEDNADKPLESTAETQAAAAAPSDASPSKRSRGGYMRLPGNMKDHLNFSMEDFSAASMGGVSLTLGLHQNGGNICFSDPAVVMPLSAVPRYGVQEEGGLGFAGDGGHLFGKEFDGHLHHVF